MPSDAAQRGRVVRGNTLSGQKEALGKWWASQRKHCPDNVGPDRSANLTGCRADNQTIQTRGVCERALKFRFGREGFQGNAIAANRTREIRPSGMRGGLAETWAMAELGTRCTYQKGACRKLSA